LFSKSTLISLHLQVVILSKKKSEKEKYRYDVLYMQNLERNDINEFIYKTDFENKECQWGRIGGGTVREFGMDMYTLLYLKWVTNEDLL